VRKKEIKRDTEVDSFLAGIKTSGSYGLKDVFSDTTGPLDPAAIKVKKNKPKKARVEKEDTTGPLDPGGIKGNKVKGPREEAPKKEKKKKKKSSGKRELSPWMIHLQEFYAEKKKVDPDYKYSQAMKDAKVTYNK
tara:strand:+ start:261 stop:665 length:405 start_codon:yes stop_codon:yes gene_type:complete